MRPEIDTARAEIQRLFGQRLDAVEAMIDFQGELTNPWRGRPLGDGNDPAIYKRDKIVAGLGVRAANTTWAALELCRIGFGQKALMLERSLFEDLADIYWVAQEEPASVVDRFMAHEEQESMLLVEAMSRHPEVFEFPEAPEFDAARRQELNDLFGPYGDRPWSGLSIHKRVEAIEHNWPEGEERNWLQFFRRIVHRQNNSTMHVSGLALAANLKEETPDGLVYNVGPTAAGIEAALWNAVWMYGQVLRLCLRHFDFPDEDKERLETLVAQGWACFKMLTPDDLRGVGRNELCPCGSGKKLKHCHGK